MRIPVGLDVGGVTGTGPAQALTSSGGLGIIPVEVAQMTQSGEQPNDRVSLTWMGRFEAIQGLEGTSIWLAIALETIKDREPEAAKNDAEMLWRLAAIRADEVMADMKELLEEIGL